MSTESLRADPPLRVTRELESALRREALGLKQERSRGHVGLKVWAGLVGADRPEPAPPHPWGPAPSDASDVAVFVTTPGERLDHQDRVQVVLSLTHVVRPRVPRPRLWLTRSGSPEPCPQDWTWLTAASSAWEALDLAPDFALVTREGWYLLPSGFSRRWQRLRS